MATNIEQHEPAGNHRWWIAVALLVSLFIAFLDRINISLALPQMATEFGWTTKQQGNMGSIMLGSFYIGYGLSNIFLSAYAGRMGTRRSLIAIVCLFSVFTALGAPASIMISLFILTRVCLGLGEGVHFPMMTTVTKHWFPLHERSRANGIWIAGAMLATIMTPILLVPVIDNFGWRAMFVVSGALGMIVTVPVLYFLVYDKPRESPYVGEAEARYIESGMEPDEGEAADWAFLKTPAFYLAMGGGILNNYCVYAIVNWLPTYFVKEKGVDFGQLAYAASLPYLVGVAAIAFYAFMGDLTQRRVLMAAIGFLGASASVYFATLAPGLGLTVLAFSGATFFQTAYTSQEFAIIQRILPARTISKATGIYNGVNILIGGVGGSMLPGIIVGMTESYNAGMLSVVIATATGGVIMLVLSRLLKY